VALLREVLETDLDVLFMHWTDPEANRMAAFAPADPSDREAFDERWRRIRESDDSTALVIEVDGKVVGSISSWTNEGEREVTYWIGREHWGKGIATRGLAEFLADVERTRPSRHPRPMTTSALNVCSRNAGSAALEYAAPSQPAEERSSMKSSSVSTPDGRASSRKLLRAAVARLLGRKPEPERLRKDDGGLG